MQPSLVWGWLTPEALATYVVGLLAINKDAFKATLKEMAEKLKAADVVQKDIIVSNLFLKLHFDQQKMTHYSLKEPFASLVTLTSFQHGGDGRN